MRYLILLCLFTSFNVFSDTSLWRVSNGSSELFIGGTIHLLSSNDYPLPAEFEQAYKLSDQIVFETNLAAMARPDVQQQLLQRVMYKKGQSLKKTINKHTYQALAKHSASVGLDMKALDQFKPPMVILTLIMAELQQLGMTEAGVDDYFNQKAIVDAKSLGALESLQVQLNVIANMGKGHEDELIMSTIAEMKELPLVMDDMKHAWRTGNAKMLEKIGILPMRSDYPELYQSLLVDRNNAWIPKIEALLATPEVEFVLVGALHLVANEGLISRLRALGYKLELF